MGYEFINPADVYWDDWTLFCVQIATLISLMIYVWKTWEMAAATRAAAEASSAAAIEAKEARLESLAPRLMVYFSPEQVNLAEVIVENIGAGTASDVKITFTPPLQASSNSLDVNRFFDTRKPIIPPRYRLVHGIDTWSAYGASRLPMRYEARVEYTGKENGRKYDEVHILDIQSLAHRFQFGKKDMEDLVQEVEKIRKILDDKLKDIDSHLSLANQLERHPVQDRPLQHWAQEICAHWAAAKTIAADGQTRFQWEPTLAAMKSMGLNALFAAARAESPEDQTEPIVRLLTLLHIPKYLRHEDYSERLDNVILELRELGEKSTASGSSTTLSS